MDIKSLGERTDLAEVRFDSRLDEDLVYAHSLRLLARRALEAMRLRAPREYPYTQVITIDDLYKREAALHTAYSDCCGGLAVGASGYAANGRQEIHGLIMHFGARIRAAEDANWPHYDR